MVSDGTNFSEFVPSKADGVVDYNNPNNVIKLGWSGDSFTAADFTYALGLSNDKKIKDVTKTEYKKWLGLDAVDNTADADKSVDYANRAGSIKNSYDGSTLNISYGAPALSYSDFTWIPVYDGNTLKTINKDMFAQASHTHSEYAANDAVTISSSQPSINTCKLWIKI